MCFAYASQKIARLTIAVSLRYATETGRRSFHTIHENDRALHAFSNTFSHACCCESFTLKIRDVSAIVIACKGFNYFNSCCLTWQDGWWA